MAAQFSEPRHARISWRCRRGMRELDLLLQKFLQTGLDSLENGDVDRLEHLLVEPDQDILAWLTRAREPEDPDTLRIVKILRSRIEADRSNRE